MSSQNACIYGFFRAERHANGRGTRAVNTRLIYLLSLLLVLAVAVPAVRAGAAVTGAEARVRNLLLVSGAEQNASVAAQLPADLVVEARDSAGNAVANAALALEVRKGGGWTPTPWAVTNEEGRVSIPWYMGPRPGEQELRAAAGAARLLITATAEPLEARKTTSGHRDYVEFIPGELPFIISAPHGGTQRPDDIPDRAYGITSRDFATDEIAHLLAEALDDLTGGRPHLVVVHLHRIKLDANRPIEEAAQGDPLAQRLWREYHGFIEAAKAWVTEHFGEGFYMDLHGHGLRNQRLQLGYLLTSTDLEQSNDELDETWAISKSSLRTLVKTSPHSHSQMVRGEVSLGAFYEQEGYPTVPSPAQPDPGGERFFSGGHNTRLHGSRDGGPISGFQLELNREGVRNTPEQRQAFAETNARVINRFFQTHFGYSLDNAAARVHTASNPLPYAANE